jgi:hypothetical protein
MPAYFRIDKDHRLVLTTISGVFTLADGLAHQEKLLKDPDFVPTFSQLIDFTQVAKVQVGIETCAGLPKPRYSRPMRAGPSS